MFVALVERIVDVITHAPCRQQRVSEHVDPGGHIIPILKMNLILCVNKESHGCNASTAECEVFMAHLDEISKDFLPRVRH